MASSVHRRPLQREPPKIAKKSAAVTTTSHVCDKCRRTFQSSHSLQQHRESVKHKPISNLSCPLKGGCQGKFTSPSALLHHLESGACRSGMNRGKMNHIAQLCDKDHIIHSVSALPASSSPTISRYSTFSDSEMSMVPVDDRSEWSLMTPTMSQGSVDGSLASWSLVEDSEISSEGGIFIDTMDAPKLRCPICPKKNKSFATTQALQQHMDSPVHCPKIYHCPSTMFPITFSKNKDGKKKKYFTTLSGLSQHLESGACKGGKRTFFYCIDLIQRHLEQSGFGGVHLLLPGSAR